MTATAKSKLMGAIFADTLRNLIKVREYRDHCEANGIDVSEDELVKIYGLLEAESEAREAAIEAAAERAK